MSAKKDPVSTRALAGTADKSVHPRPGEAGEMVWPVVAPAYSFALSQALGAFLRSTRQRLGERRERERLLGAISARVDGLESYHLIHDKRVVGDVFESTDWIRVLIENDADRAATIGESLLVSGAIDHRVALGVALIEEMQSRADPVFQAVVDQTQRLDNKFRASIDSGLAADWMPEILLAALDDPNLLPDRDGEVAYLLHEWNDPFGYEVLVGAPFSGKSTLLAYCVTHCPESIDVVSFFIRRAGGRNTRAQFLDVVTAQLRALLNEPGIASADAATGDRVFRDLWNQACERAARHERPLVLVVDALDEQADEAQPISAMLPSVVPRHAMVCVSCRPNPTHFVLDGGPLHPLNRTRDDPLQIDATAGIADVRSLADAELRHALGWAGGIAGTDTMGGEVLVALAAVDRPIDVTSLSDLLGSPLNEIKRRTETMSTIALLPNDAVEIAHDVYRDWILDQSALIEEMRTRLRHWAKSWSEAGWPVDAPDFLVSTYAQTLQEPAELADLLDLEYRAAVTRKHGHLQPVLRAIEDCTSSALMRPQCSDDSIANHVRLALIRLEIGRSQDSLPRGFVAALLRNGLIDRAIRVAVETSDPRIQLRSALEITNEVGLRFGWPEVAIQLASQLPDREATQLLIALLKAGHDPETIQQLPNNLANENRPELDDANRAQLLVALAQVGHKPDANLAKAADLASTLHGSRLAYLLVSMCRAGYDPNRIADLSTALEDFDRAQVLLEFGRTGHRSGASLAAAADLVTTIPDKFHQACVLVDLATAGHDSEACLEAAGDLVPLLDNERERTWLLVALTRAGRSPERIIDLASTVDSRHWRSHILVALVHAGYDQQKIVDLCTTFSVMPGPVLAALAEAGYDPAEIAERATKISNQHDAAEVLVSLAAAGYNRDRIAILADDLIDRERAEVLTALAHQGFNADTNLAIASELRTRRDNWRGPILTALAKIGEASGAVADLVISLHGHNERTPFYNERAAVLIALAAKGYDPNQIITLASTLAGSDRARVLTALVRSDGDQQKIADLSETLRDYDQASVLVELATAGYDPTRIADLASKFEDEIQRARVLAALAWNGHDPGEIADLAETLHGSSKALVLVALAKNTNNAEANFSTAMGLAKDLHPHYRKSVLTALARAGYKPERVELLAATLNGLERAQVLAALIRSGYDPERIATTVASFNDRYACAVVLVALAQSGHDSARVNDLVASINSDFQRAWALISLGRAGHDPARRFDEAARLAGRLDSAFGRTQVLIALATAGYDRDQIERLGVNLEDAERAKVLVALANSPIGDAESSSRYQIQALRASPAESLPSVILAHPSVSRVVLEWLQTV